MQRQFQGLPWQGGFPGQVQGGFPGQQQGGFPGQFPGGFPGQQQGGFPGQFPGGFPGQQGLQQPPGPPPSFTPQAPQTFQAPGRVGVFAVDPGAIRRCLFRWTYIWLRGREQFWFFPVFVGRRSIAGFRWYDYGWYYFGVDLRRIQQFRCF